uniref:Uncharacterized protein n=2 Tax=Avena sativa TaxID=4498 RepID=A0ACD5Z0Z9_AVESA
MGSSYVVDSLNFYYPNFVEQLNIFCSTYCTMESLKLKRFHGILKVSGIVLCAAGVTVLALYQGPKPKSFVHHPSRADTHPSGNWTLGILLQSLAAVTFALWTVFQGPLLVEYPSMLLNTAVQVVFATVQSVFIALVMERDLSRWKLSLDVGLCGNHLLCRYMRTPQQPQRIIVSLEEL